MTANICSQVTRVLVTLVPTSARGHSPKLVLPTEQSREVFSYPLIKRLMLLCTLFSVNAFPINLANASAENTLYIYSPSYTKAHVIQKKISGLCPDLNVAVYGKAKDFKKQIKVQAPDAAISLAVVIRQYDNYQALMQGQKSGKHEEDYYLVSVDSALAMKDLAGKKVGVIDLLGRKPMTNFIKTLLGKVSVNRVAKADDLLPLLNFNAVDALFISKTDLDNLKKTTQLNLATTKTTVRLGLSIIAYRPLANKSALSTCVEKFDKSINDYLRVENWRATK